MSDPEHLTGFKISNLYHHWLAHQKKRPQPFVITNPGPLHQIYVRKSEKLKGKKTEYEPVSSKDEGEGPSNSWGEGGKTTEKAFEEKKVLDDEDDCHPPPKFGPPSGKSRRGTDVQLESTSKRPDGHQVSINLYNSSEDFTLPHILRGSLPDSTGLKFQCDMSQLGSPSPGGVCQSLLDSMESGRIQQDSV